MSRVLVAIAALLVWLWPAWGEILPPLKEEIFHYVINWPSGLSLGEGEMRSTQVNSEDGTVERWEFDLSLEAAVPGFQVLDSYHSVASPELCSLEFEKVLTHGKRKAKERTTFDAQRRVATRQTLGGGGKSEIPTPTCARDALAFLHHVRRELSRGRVPPPQTIFFGAPYQIRFGYGGRQRLRLSQEVVEADRMIASVKGKASEATFEIFFAVDEARTPVLVRVPLPLSTFTMELVR